MFNLSRGKSKYYEPEGKDKGDKLHIVVRVKERIDELSRKSHKLRKFRFHRIVIVLVLVRCRFKFLFEL